MTLKDVNIRAVLNKIRPGSAYHWAGSGSTGNEYDAIGEWRDESTKKPTEQEILDAWPAVKAAIEAEQTRRENQEAIDKLVDDPRKFFYLLRGVMILHNRQQVIMKHLLITRPAEENAEMNQLVALAEQLNQMAGG